MPTIGAPTALAMCAGPVSPVTKSDAPRANATTSAIEVGGSIAAAPQEPSATSRASASSPGPQSTTDGRPWIARSADVIVANRDGIHRLFGHAAPTLMTAYRPPVDSATSLASRDSTTSIGNSDGASPGRK